MKLSPALSEIFASDTSEFAKVFSTYMTPGARRPPRPRPSAAGDTVESKKPAAEARANTTRITSTHRGMTSHVPLRYVHAIGRPCPATAAPCGRRLKRLALLIGVPPWSLPGRCS